MACLWSTVAHGIAMATIEAACAELATATEEAERKGWRK